MYIRMISQLSLRLGHVMYHVRVTCIEKESSRVSVRDRSVFVAGVVLYAVAPSHLVAAGGDYRRQEAMRPSRAVLLPV